MAGNGILSTPTNRAYEVEIDYLIYIYFQIAHLAKGSAKDHEDAIHNILDLMIDINLVRSINWTGRPYQNIGAKKYTVQKSKLHLFIKGKYP